MSIAGSSSLRRLKDAALIMHLHELAPIGGRATGRRDWRRHERFAEMGQDLPDRPWFLDERDQPDVAATVRALKRKLLPHPRHELIEAGEIEVLDEHLVRLFPFRQARSKPLHELHERGPGGRSRAPAPPRRRRA